MTDLKQLAARLEKLAYDEKLKLSDEERNDILAASYELNAATQAEPDSGSARSSQPTPPKSSTPASAAPRGGMAMLMDGDGPRSNAMAAEISSHRRAVEIAYRHLMNLQPHIAQLSEEDRKFIDPHVDEAMKVLSRAGFGYTKECWGYIQGANSDLCRNCGKTLAEHFDARRRK